jgi:alcohol dehydrogenase class IV
MKSNWNYPTNVWVGEGRSLDLIEACKVSKVRKALFVTDRDLVSLPMTLEIIENLKNSFGKIDVFSDFTGNPTGKNITEGVKIYNNNSCDGVIAFGGGSALDVGEAIAFMCGQTRPIWDFEDIGDYWKRAEESKISPIIAIPTTAGTGSETGRASAIINEETGVKKNNISSKIYAHNCDT